MRSGNTTGWDKTFQDCAHTCDILVTYLHSPPDSRGATGIAAQCAMADRDSERGLSQSIERPTASGGRDTLIVAAKSGGETRGNDLGSMVKGGMRRWLFVILGCFFTGLGGIGVVLPGIPTTPFLLVASYFFIRSSPRLHSRLLASKRFGPILRDWDKHRGLKRGVKRFAMLACTVAITLSIAFGGLPWPAQVVVALAGAYGIWFVSRLPEVPDDVAR